MALLRMGMSAVAPSGPNPIAGLMTATDPKRKSLKYSTGAPFVFAYRRVKTPNKNPNLKAIAKAEVGLRLIASSA